jgi:hypothetical protein
MYSGLLSSGGTLTPIADVPVTTTPFYTGSIWNMGNPDQYPPGTYTLWAECNVNHMKDNYGVSGKTISSQFSLLNQGVNPLIRTYTTAGTILPTTRVTTAVPTVVTTPPTTVATQPPTVVTTILITPPPQTATSVPPTPVPTKKSPGFEALLAGAALLIGLAACGKRE